MFFRVELFKVSCINLHNRTLADAHTASFCGIRQVVAQDRVRVLKLAAVLAAADPNARWSFRNGHIQCPGSEYPLYHKITGLKECTSVSWTRLQHRCVKRHLAGRYFPAFCAQPFNSSASIISGVSALACAVS